MKQSAATTGHSGPADLAKLAVALHDASDDDPIDGTLVAGADGLVLATEMPGAQADTVAAMAVIMAGIATQLVEQAGLKESRACLVESSSGHVAVFPLEADMVLVVFGQNEVTTGMFNLAARGVLSRLQEAITRDGVLNVHHTKQVAEKLDLGVQAIRLS